MGVDERYRIVDVKAIEVLDSRGQPTVEAEVVLASGIRARGICPSGASTGQYEAVQLKDGDASRYFGKGVLSAVKNVNTIIRDAIVGMDVRLTQRIDNTLVELDGTKGKSCLGGNAILAVSIACFQAAAKSIDMTLFNYIGGSGARCLPVPMINVINGGMHAVNGLDIQEFMILPVASDTFSEALRMSCEVFMSLRDVLVSSAHSVNVGDEGGFAPAFSKTSEAIEAILKAIEVAGYKPGEDFSLALDCAATSFYDKERGDYSLDEARYTPEALLDYYAKLVDKYPIFSIEDPFYEADHASFAALNAKIGDRIQLVGDDIFCTNTELLLEGVKCSVANSILIKPNQVGTISESIDAINVARRNGLNTVVSHRSGETEDVTISHLAVGMNALQIKTGSLSRTDRVSKYNELLRIESHLGKEAVYPGKDILSMSVKR